MIGPAGSFDGPLVSRVFLLERCGPTRIARLDPSAFRRLRAVAGQAVSFGPASPVRAVADRVAIPLAALLGFTVRDVRVSPAGTLAATLVSDDRPLAVLAVRPAGDPPTRRASRSFARHSRADSAGPSSITPVTSGSSTAAALTLDAGSRSASTERYLRK